MLIREILPFAREYVELLSVELKQGVDSKELSLSQRYWLMFCLTALLITNQLSWSLWERLSGGVYDDGALSWMFRKSYIPWESLLAFSTRLVLKQYGISEGVLIIDDTDTIRSQHTKKIAWVHTLKDKLTGGHRKGQNIVFLVLCTGEITLPVGLQFYMPDPKLKQWEVENKRQIEAGIKRKDRPRAPERNPDCPTKLVIAAELIADFKQMFPNFRVRCILADALYGSCEFVNTIEQLYPQAQIVTQLRSNQLIINERGLLEVLPKHFKKLKSKKATVTFRGRKEQAVIYISKKLKVKAHGKKRFIIAIKYKDERQFRYLVATDMTWRVEDIIQAYSLRWLVEVFIQDWKSHEGWSFMAKQQGAKGSFRGVVLSLLLDHALFFHEDQESSIEGKLPLVTIGSLTEKCRIQSLVANISEIFESDNPKEELHHLRESIEMVTKIRRSTKHLNGIGLDSALRFVA